MEESTKITKNFAVLVEITKKSLEAHGVSADTLKDLIRRSSFSNLLQEVIQIKALDDLVLKLGDYWSFFDHELLKIIIESFCGNLAADLKEYECEFKSFCDYQLCELPKGIFGVAEDENCLHLKFDESTIACLWDIKELSSEVSKLLQMKFVLQQNKDGCLELVSFLSSPLPPPLTFHQILQLQEVKIVQVYTEKHEYFR